MKFVVLVLGILLFCAAAAFFVINHSPIALCAALAGLAVIAGEGFRIALDKQLEEVALAKAEEKLGEDMKQDHIA